MTIQLDQSAIAAARKTIAIEVKKQRVSPEALPNWKDYLPPTLPPSLKVKKKPFDIDSPARSAFQKRFEELEKFDHSKAPNDHRPSTE